MLSYEKYEEHEKHLPTSGRFIIAQYDKDSVIVYQAFNEVIARYAVDNQRFGGTDYDFNRITWIKPSFLWMMYYSGWANNKNQENVLAIRLSRTGFDQLLQYAVMARCHQSVHKDKDNIYRHKDTGDTEIRLDWVSYHDLHGNKTNRKAVKIGIEGDMLHRYNDEWIQEIENITPYVTEQQQLVAKNKISMVSLPRERVYAPADLSLLTKIDATTISL